MKIDVRDAQVKTAAVEIQTLTISGKQVTLAVFRQIQQATVPLEERHRIWGRVNYCPEGRKCQGGFRHVHVVWQDGTELRRDWIDPPKRVHYEISDPPEISFMDGDWPLDDPEPRRLWDEIRALPQLFIAV